MKVLIGCESSGMVRRAFAALGHDAWSVDLDPAADGSNKHIVGDVRDYCDDDSFDLLAVFHPPCTRLCNSGIRWLSDPPIELNSTYSEEMRAAFRSWDREHRLEFMWRELDEGAALFSRVWNSKIKRVCVENPRMHRHAKARIENFRPAAQTAQPWWFGDPEFKGIGLWLRELPLLVPTNKLVPPKPGTAEHRKWSRVHRAVKSADRWRERSKFFPGIAAAMAAQWGGDADAEQPDFFRRAA